MGTGGFIVRGGCLDLERAGSDRVVARWHLPGARSESVGGRR